VASLQRPSLREGFPAVLGGRLRGITGCAGCASSARTDAANQITKRAARASPPPALLGAAQAPPRPYGRP